MLFQIYGEHSLYQLLGWVLVFVGLIVLNEIARRSKAGGIGYKQPNASLYERLVSLCKALCRNSGMHRLYDA